MMVSGCFSRREKQKPPAMLRWWLIILFENLFKLGQRRLIAKRKAEVFFFASLKSSSGRF
ncbi:hypothetical protein DHL47_10435 [Streptococcus panodentis]|uniref:Uncharacterized protein n=2 Tax=Streptococcus TaxID=1301 RepID=A0ABS5AZ76_9STRE|nr:hypothetical protein [Streptococcus panodentis]